MQVLVYKLWIFILVKSIEFSIQFLLPNRVGQWLVVQNKKVKDVFSSDTYICQFVGIWYLSTIRSGWILRLGICCIWFTYIFLLLADRYRWIVKDKLASFFWIIQCQQWFTIKISIRHFRHVFDTLIRLHQVFHFDFFPEKWFQLIFNLLFKCSMVTDKHIVKNDKVNKT